MNPYKVLGLDLKTVPPCDHAELIQSAYRKLSKKKHPDVKGGSAEAFAELKLAYDILSDPERRKRYDTTGRLDESKITPERVRMFIQGAMQGLVEAHLRASMQFGFPQAQMNNPRDEIIRSVVDSRQTMRVQEGEIQKRIDHLKRLIKRFKPKEAFDPVGDAMRNQLTQLEDQLRGIDDARELSLEVERVMKTYEYSVDPQEEGQFTQGPTTRRSGAVFLT